MLSHKHPILLFKPWLLDSVFISFPHGSFPVLTECKQDAWTHRSQVSLMCNRTAPPSVHKMTRLAQIQQLPTLPAHYFKTYVHFYSLRSREGNLGPENTLATGTSMTRGSCCTEQSCGVVPLASGPCSSLGTNTRTLLTK